MPATTPKVELERCRRLLTDRAEVEDAASEHAALAAALVEAEVRPQGRGVLRGEPRRAEVEPDLLVGRQREQDVAR
jgi:hypothetical protein